MKKFPVIVTAVIVVFCIGFTMLFMSGDETDINNALSAFRGSTQDSKPISVEKIVSEIEDNQKEPALAGIGSTGDPDLMPGLPAGADWLEVLENSYRLMRSTYPHYDQGTILDIPIGSEVYKTRFDCSGYISLCLKRRGLLSANTNISSSSGSSGGSIAGVSTFVPSSPSDLKAGDIIFYNGHVEALATDPFMENGKLRCNIYNWGSEDRVRTEPSYYSKGWENGTHSFSNIKNVWRVN